MHHSVERLQLRTHERREGRNEMPNLLLKVPSLNETSRTPFAWANGGIVVYTMYYAIPCASYGKIYSTMHQCTHGLVSTRASACETHYKTQHKTATNRRTV